MTHVSDPFYRSRGDPDFDHYLVTDEFAETIDALEHLSHLLNSDAPQRTKWKWIILCAHNALQNAAVCILTHTAGVGALTDKSEKELLERLDGDWNSDTPWPRERLADFPELMCRLQGKTELRYVRKPDWTKFDIATDIARLHLYRNDFMHFTPKSWLLELEGVPRIIRHSIQVTRGIVDSPAYSRFNRFADFDTDGLFARVLESLDRAEIELRRGLEREAEDE